MKDCWKCRRQLEETEFHSNRSTRDGLATECKECAGERVKTWYAKNTERAKANIRAWNEKHPETRREYSRVWRERHPEKQRDVWLRHKYGIVQADVDAMKLAQGGRCGACDEPTEKFHIDHDHRTGEVRGLLCAGCNFAAGLLEDDPRRAEGLAEYLRRGTKENRDAV